MEPYGSGPVIVLRRGFRDIEDDGLSFGLDEETGVLITVTVRALTEEERQEWQELKEWRAQVDAAYDALFTAHRAPTGLFGWGRYGEQLPADAAECAPTDIPAEGRRTVHIMSTPWALTHAGNSI